MRYSVIIPVYNRPEEVDELLHSLTKQTYKSFEVVIVEDGSDQPAEHIVEKYTDQLDISYYFKENSGQGFSRNYGFKRANGDYFVVFDSDCIIPKHYFESVNKRLEESNFTIDCWGGPDRAHESFSTIQKAINYSMTSFFTTGGIRGRKKQLGPYHPRSFNMGISKEVFEKTGGYRITRMGEDLEFSIRIINQGFRSVLIPDAYVYHKRRTSMLDFFRQLHFFGRARININRFHPGQIKLVHLFPLFFLIGIVLIPITLMVSQPIFYALATAYGIYTILLLFESFIKEKQIKVAILSVAAGYTQLCAYAVGFITELFRRQP